MISQKDLEVRLRQTFTAVAERTAISPRTAPTEEVRSRRRAGARIQTDGQRMPAPNRARLIVALVAAVSVLAVAAATVVVRNLDSGDTQRPANTTDPTLPPLFTPEGEQHGTLFLVPTFVPEGFELFRVAGGRTPGAPSGAGGSPGTDGAQTWLRLDATNTRAIQRFSISWGSGATGIIDPRTSEPLSRDPLEGYRTDSTPVEVRGTQGYYSHGNLRWEEPAGKLAAISSEDRFNEHLSLDQLLSIAEGLRVRDDGGFEPTRVPPGFRFAGEHPGLASDGTNKREVVYQSADGRGFMLTVLDASEKSPASNLSDPRAHIVSVRGFDAVATPMLYNGVGTYDSQTAWLFGSDQHLQWIEPGNVLVQLESVGLDEAALVEVARGLGAVDEQGWDAFTAQAPGRVGAPATPQGARPPFSGEEAEIAEAFRAAFEGDTVEQIASYLEDGDQLHEAIATTFMTVANATSYSAEVHTIKLVDDRTALVTFSVLSEGRASLPNQQGAAVEIDGRWLVRRATYCAVIELGKARCPSRPIQTATGPPPADQAEARRAVTEIFIRANDSDTPLGERIALVDDPTGLRDAYEAARRSFPKALANYTVEVHDVRFLDANEASVSYDLIVPDAPVTEFLNRSGRVVRVDREWKVTRQTVCGILGLAQAGGCQP